MLKQLNVPYVEYSRMPQHIADNIDEGSFTNGVFRFIYFDEDGEGGPEMRTWCINQGIPDFADRVLVYFDW